jgi:hypothetical protein
MAAYIYKGIVCGAQQRVRCCSGAGPQDRVEYNHWPVKAKLLSP